MAKRKLFLLDNTWKTLDDGMDSINRSIALEFKKFENVEVFCTVLLHKDNELSKEDKEDAKNNDVTLVYTENYDVMFPDYNYMTEAFNQDPFPYLPNIWKEVQGITHIVAHWPYTVQAGFLIRDVVYPEAEVILVVHVIPEELQWLEDDLPYSIFPNDDFLRVAEEADYVFSFTQKVYNHFESVFRNQSKKKIDHNMLIPEGHKELFGLKRKGKEPNDVPIILALTYGNDSFRYDGLDIAACATNKVAEKLQETEAFAVKLVIGIYGEKTDTQEIKTMINEFIKNAFVMVEYHHYDNVRDLMKDLELCTLVLSPTRCEPFGSPLVHILSAGVPTLVSGNSHMSTYLKKLVNYSSAFLVPVTNNMKAVWQDATIWNCKIIEMLKDPDKAKANATHLQVTLRRDEASKTTLDTLKAVVLGGIGFQLQVLSVDKVGISQSILKSKEEAESALFIILRHCTRLKHHLLTREDDLEDIFPDYHKIPFTDILDEIVDKIEGLDRKIVKCDQTTRQLIVFCPTPEALSDLWANCDVINRAFQRILAADDTFLQILGVKSVKTRCYISGPEFLKYKQTILTGSTKRKIYLQSIASEEEEDVDDQSDSS